MKYLCIHAEPHMALVSPGGEQGDNLLGLFLIHLKTKWPELNAHVEETNAVQDAAIALHHRAEVEASDGSSETKS